MTTGRSCRWDLEGSTLLERSNLVYFRGKLLSLTIKNTFIKNHMAINPFYALSVLDKFKL
ncbi:MAG: hypothetical protein JWO58_2258 [Chitinophagaceae bacterium]|nr:hypothetical protein [Chitinophagaceae bacterium]